MITVSIGKSDIDSLKPKTEVTLKAFVEHLDVIKTPHQVEFKLLDPETKDPFYHSTYVTGSNQSISESLLQSFEKYYKKKKLTKAEYQTVLQWFEQSDMKPKRASFFMKTKKKRLPSSPQWHLWRQKARGAAAKAWTLLKPLMIRVRRFIIYSLKYSGRKFKTFVIWLWQKWQSHRKKKKRPVLPNQKPERVQVAHVSQVTPATDSGPSLEEPTLSTLVEEKINQKIRLVKKKEREMERQTRAHEKALKREKKKQAILLRELKRNTAERRRGPALRLGSWLFRLIVLYVLAWLIVVKLQLNVPNWFFMPGDALISLLKSIGFSKQLRGW